MLIVVLPLLWTRASRYEDFLQLRLTLTLAQYLQPNATEIIK